MSGRPQLSSRTGATYKLATFLNDNWDDKVGRTNEDVAQELGYRAANMISMWRTGKTRIALEKMPDIARIMKMDLALLMPLWFEQYWGDRDDADALFAMISDRIVTSNELPLVTTVRKARKGKDLAFTSDTLKAVAKVVTDTKAAERALEPPEKA